MLLKRKSVLNAIMLLFIIREQNKEAFVPSTHLSRLAKHLFPIITPHLTLARACPTMITNPRSLRQSPPCLDWFLIIVVIAMVRSTHTGACDIIG